MKIIFSDYDGTLNHGGITEKKLLSLKKWREAGNLFCVISGRGKEFFFELKEKNIRVDYFLSCNGAHITDGDFNVISDIRCDGRIAVRLISFLFSCGCPFVNICNESSVRVKNDSFPEEEGIPLSKLGEIDYFNQISTICDSFQRAEEVTAMIAEHFGEYVNPLQNGICIDIVPVGMDKAQGIYILTEKIGLEKKDVIAVGDNVNDAAMIREFYSYAMANGVSSIKEAADRITESIEQLIEREI